MSSSGGAKGPVPPAPMPSWRFELLHAGCVHQTMYVTKALFLLLDSVSVLGLLLLGGRLLRHRWRAQRRREERWAALQQQHQAGHGWGDGEAAAAGHGDGTQKGAARMAGWRRWWATAAGCLGWGGVGPMTRWTIGDLFERLVRLLVGVGSGRSRYRGMVIIYLFIYLSIYRTQRTGADALRVGAALLRDRLRLSARLQCAHRHR
jgi:hypothetical protein